MLCRASESRKSRAVAAASLGDVGQLRAIDPKRKHRLACAIAAVAGGHTNVLDWLRGARDNEAAEYGGRDAMATAANRGDSATIAWFCRHCTDGPQLADDILADAVRAHSVRAFCAVMRVEGTLGVVTRNAIGYANRDALALLSAVLADHPAALALPVARKLARRAVDFCADAVMDWLLSEVLSAEDCQRRAFHDGPPIVLHAVAKGWLPMLELLMRHGAITRDYCRANHCAWVAANCWTPDAAVWLLTMDMVDKADLIYCDLDTQVPCDLVYNYGCRTSMEQFHHYLMTTRVARHPNVYLRRHRGGAAVLVLAGRRRPRYWLPPELWEVILNYFFHHALPRRDNQAARRCRRWLRQHRPAPHHRPEA